MRTHLCTQDIGRHEKSASKTVSSLLLVDATAWSYDHMSEFMCQVKTLALRPCASLDNYHTSGVAILSAHFCGKPIDIVEVERQNLYASFFQQFGQLRNGVVSQPPVFPDGTRGIFGIAHLRHGVRSTSRLLPFDTTHMKKVLNSKISLQHVDGARFQHSLLL